MTRVLVCDDSATSRAHLAAVLRAHPDFDVVGEARDGPEAVRMALVLRPDIVLMDLWMPGGDGLEATMEIMAQAPTPVVIVTGSAAVSDVKFGLEAVRAGALALIAKPAGPGHPAAADEARRLVETVRTMAGVKVVRRSRAGTRVAPPATTRPGARPGPALPAAGRGHLRAVAVAASTGGPAAVQQILVNLPPTFPAPVLLVQHITAGFTDGLAAWLGTACRLPVKLAAAGEPLRAGTVYVAPDGYHLEASGPPHAVVLSSRPAVGGFRPAGTVLFESTARAFGSGLAAVILTGMGDDGVAGLAAVKRAGGVVFGQDEKSCVVYGMPGAAAAAGLVDHALPPADIAAKLLELAR